ncbi:MAG: hypothetical protein GX442_25405 [Candidatus Riflebacteria bacterium]|nr:hypothetical protein [Candidatus Riflebacteria bacterium]
MKRTTLMTVLFGFLLAVTVVQADPGYVKLVSKARDGKEAAMAQIRRFEKEAGVKVITFRIEFGEVVTKHFGNLIAHVFIDAQPTTVPPQFRKQIRWVAEPTLVVVTNLGDERVFASPHSWTNTFRFQDWNALISFVERWQLFSENHLPLKAWMEFNNIAMNEAFHFNYAQVMVKDGNHTLYGTNLVPLKKGR